MKVKIYKNARGDMPRTIDDTTSDLIDTLVRGLADRNPYQTDENGRKRCLFCPALKTQHGELVSLADGSTLMTEAQDSAMWAMAREHLEGVPLNVNAELVIVRVTDDRVVRKYNRQAKRWENEPI